MATTNNVENIVIEPVDAVYGAQHRVCFTATDGSGIAADYFTFSTPETSYYFWYNTGADVDPAPGGLTEGAEIAVLVGDTAAQIASKTVSAINLVASTIKAHAKISPDDTETFILEAKLMGEPLAVASIGTTTFTLVVAKVGFKTELGYIDGNVEVGLNEQLFDITAHQTGTQLLGQLRTGVTPGPITLSLKETVAEKLKSLMDGIGVDYTPSGGTEVKAVGALAGSKQFQNVVADAGKLVLHPTKNALDNYADDFAFWVAYPKLNNLVFSGEENRMIEVEFSIFLDQSKVNEASVFVYGDHTQNFLK